MKMKKESETECKSNADDSDHAKTHEPTRQRKRKSNAEKQREYRQREKNKNISEEKKRQVETQEFTEKLSQLSMSQIHIHLETVAGTCGIIKNVPESLEGSQRKRKSNAEKQREYRQREKIKKVLAEKKRKVEKQEFTEKINPDERKLRNAAYSKAYRDRKKIQKFSNIESEIQSQKSQTFISHLHIQVDPEVGTSGTIQNVPVSLEESQRHRHIRIETPIANKNVPVQCKTRSEQSIHIKNIVHDKIVPLVSQSVQQYNQVGREQNIDVNRHVHIENEMDGDEFEGGIDNDFEEESSDDEFIKPNPLRCPNQSDIRQTSTSTDQMGNHCDTIINKYKDYDRHVAARVLFHQQLTQNSFGHACKICDRLWFKNDLKLVKEDFQELFQKIIENYQDGSTVAVCSMCYVSTKKNKIPNLSKYNGFKYPNFPIHLPKLDIISERLISPQLPFMQIKRLRHYGQQDQYKIYGQIINIPIEVNNMVRNLPRDLDNEHSIYIHIQKKLIHKGYYLRGLVNKQNIKIWLSFLIDTPLYKEYGISINEKFFNNVDNTQSYNDINDVSEHIPNEETLTAQQQTLLWDEDKFLCITSGEGNSSINLLFDNHAEELSFPTIYLGQFRKYEIAVTPFMQVTSELRRADRRGATPNHILYLAMKIMRMGVRDSLTVAFKHNSSSNSITKEQIMGKDYINTCIKSNLAFLKNIPNSTWYWSGRKGDLFAMIRQLGKPTAFMTLSANEIKWISLLKILHKLKNNCDEISSEAIEQLDTMERSDLVNEDPVTCVIYFNKLINVLMTILMSKRNSPFGKYYVIHYFKRIEFQHSGSPDVHIFLWLNNAPNYVLDKNYNKAIEIINSLSSVSASEASGNMKLNMHKHTNTCYKKKTNQQYKKCRFEAPFMPSKQTVILSPMDKDDENYSTFRKQYTGIRLNLESYSYTDFDDFYNHNTITSDQQYYDIIRAGINRPTVFIKRLPTEKWHMPFNPFVFHLLQSNMNFQLILDEYSCAQYVVEYVNKTDRGISHLQKKFIQVMDEHPECDIEEITRKISVKMLNTVEMTSQEAAWYLLREPMSKSSTAVVYIPTVLPYERKKIRKTMEELEKLDYESTDLWNENIFEKYEKRPEYLNDVSLSQFVSKYYKKIKTGQYVQRKNPKIIRYRNYDLAENFDEYRREMVTLHIPFKNEQEDILLDRKYINTYEENKDIIMEKRKEFESDLDIEKIMRICRQLSCDNDDFYDYSEVAETITDPETLKTHRAREEDPSSIYKSLNGNFGGTDTRTNAGPEPITPAADYTYTIEQTTLEFLEIKEETIEEKFPSTSNEDIENASKPSSSVDFTYDPLPIKKEVCADTYTSFDDNPIVYQEPIAVKEEVCDETYISFDNKSIANQDPIAVKEEVCDETYISFDNKSIANQDPIAVKEEVCDETGFDDSNTEENVLLSMLEINNPTSSAETPLLKLPIVALPTHLVAPPVPAVTPADNILLGTPRDLDIYEKFMLSKAQDIKSLSNIDDKVKLLNNIERLINVYISKDTHLRIINPNSNVSPLSSVIISSPAVAVINPEPININIMPSTSQIGKRKT